MTAKRDPTPVSGDAAPKKRAKRAAPADAPAATPEAAPVTPKGGCVTPGRVVIFTMDDQRYALPIEVVQEIQQIVTISELPEASPAILGVINLRGVVVPVVDLRLLVGLPAVAYGLQTPMLFVRTAKGLVALIVDEVEDVMEVPAGAAQRPSRMYALSEFLHCVVRSESGIVFVFDVDRLVPAGTIDAVGGAR